MSLKQVLTEINSKRRWFLSDCICLSECCFSFHKVYETQIHLAHRQKLEKEVCSTKSSGLQICQVTYMFLSLFCGVVTQKLYLSSWQASTHPMQQPSCLAYSVAWKDKGSPGQGALWRPTSADNPSATDLPLCKLQAALKSNRNIF